MASAVTSIEERSEPHVRAFSVPVVPLAPASTVSQRNAVRSAEGYLDFSGFSRGGLIAQLEFDGFTPAQAAYGATAAGL